MKELRFFQLWVLSMLLTVVGIVELVARLAIIGAVSIVMLGIPLFLLAEDGKLGDLLRPVAFDVIPRLWDGKAGKKL